MTEELAQLGTEQPRPDAPDLDLLSVEELVSLMCADTLRVPEAVVAAQSSIARAVEVVADRLDQGGRLIYVGAGTAGRLGMLDAVEAGPTFNAPRGQVVAVLAGGAAAFELPVENAEDDPAAGAAAMRELGVGDRDAVVGIAASGRTPFVLGAIEAARTAGARTVGLACNTGSALSTVAEFPIEVVVGPEILAGSTRLNAGTAQKIVLNVLSTAAMVQLGKTFGPLMVDLRATNTKLRARAARIVSELAGVPLEDATKALERAEWRPKTAIVTLLGGVEAPAAAELLERHRGRLRSAVAEVSPTIPVETKRLGVAAAYVRGRIVPGDVAVADGEVVAVGLPGRGDGLAIPPLVDAQVNGYAGIDLLAADEVGIEHVNEALRRDGVGAYLPTLITSEEEVLVSALRRLARVASRGTGIAGVHLEGPFLSPGCAGVHPVEHLRLPDRRLLERLLEAGPVRMVTLAPELPGTLELIELCVARDVVVSLGHTVASSAEARRAFAAGASAVTHLFNAMPPLAGRDPGLVGAALAEPGVAVQAIADGVHVDDDSLRVAVAAAAGRWSLVSDAIAATALGDGTFALGSVEVEVFDGVARRGDGTLAGGATRLTDCLARVGRLGVEIADAVAAVTDRPARLCGVPAPGLYPGAAADLVVLDEELRVQRVLARGVELEPAGAPPL